MTVLVPVDGSECSFRALNHAIEYVERFGTDLHVVHVTDHHVEATDNLLERARGTLAEAGIDDEPEVVTELKKFRVADRTGEAIAHLVDERDYEHVVMGTHGAGAAERVLLGSTSETVIEEAGVPVTVVP